MPPTIRDRQPSSLARLLNVKVPQILPLGLRNQVLSHQWSLPPSPGAAVRAQLELAQGNVAAAIRWADNSGMSVGDVNLSYPREGEYLALARVRIAQGREDPASPFLQDALHLLERLLREAEAKARMGSVLEILVLRALAQQAQGDRAAALSTLERALLLAEPEGYIHLFVDEGAPMLALLRLAQARGMVPGYIATLLAAFGEHTRMKPAFHTARSSSLSSWSSWTPSEDWGVYCGCGIMVLWMKCVSQILR